MIFVKYRDKRSLVILHDSKDDNSRNEGATIGEFNTGFKERLCKSASYAFQNRKPISADDSTNVSLYDKIGVAKHDSELYHWRVTADKSNNIGIDSILKSFLSFDTQLSTKF